MTFRKKRLFAKHLLYRRPAVNCGKFLILLMGIFQHFQPALFHQGTV